MFNLVRCYMKGRWDLRRPTGSAIADALNRAPPPKKKPRTAPVYGALSPGGSLPDAGHSRHEEDLGTKTVDTAYEAALMGRVDEADAGEAVEAAGAVATEEGNITNKRRNSMPGKVKTARPERSKPCDAQIAAAQFALTPSEFFPNADLARHEDHARQGGRQGMAYTLPMRRDSFTSSRGRGFDAEVPAGRHLARDKTGAGESEMAWQPVVSRRRRKSFTSLRPGRR